jgi:hypothetical protein
MFRLKSITIEYPAEFGPEERILTYEGEYDGKHCFSSEIGGSCVMLVRKNLFKLFKQMEKLIKENSKMIK